MLRKHAFNKIFPASFCEIAKMGGEWRYTKYLQKNSMETNKNFLASYTATFILKTSLNFYVKLF